ncbi:hypothetical protein IPM65_00350 [Candidatus Roizmanbacteria bacterium]|nr:MAG: hypothetical protein IPM65_00350 [Candidatus Roizmanbacteria bacterium]
MMGQKKYITLIISLLLIIIPFIVLPLFPRRDDLRGIDIFAFISIVTGFLTFSVLAVSLIIGYFTRQKLSLKKTAAIFLLTVLIEIVVLPFVPSITQFFLHSVGIYLVEGLDDKIFGVYTTITDSILAGILYTVAGYFIYFTSPQKNIKASLFLGLLRMVVPILFALPFLAAE